MRNFSKMGETKDEKTLKPGILESSMKHKSSENRNSSLDARRRKRSYVANSGKTSSDDLNFIKFPEIVLKTNVQYEPSSESSSSTTSEKIRKIFTRTNEKEISNLKLCSLCNEKGAKKLCEKCNKMFHQDCIDKPAHRKTGTCKITRAKFCSDNNESTDGSILSIGKRYTTEESFKDVDKSSDGSFKQLDNSSTLNLSKHHLRDRKPSSVGKATPITSSSESKSSSEIDYPDFVDSKSRKGCRVCKKIGLLYLCRKCKSYFHMKCLIHPLEENLPPPNWICFICETNPEDYSLEKIHFYRFYYIRPSELQIKCGALDEPVKTRIYFVKFRHVSYWKSKWITETYLKYYHSAAYTSFKRKNDLDEPMTVEYGFNDYDENEFPQDNDGDDFLNYNLEDRYYRFGVKPCWLEIDRIVHQRIKSNKLQYLIKWVELPYSNCTWEDKESKIFAVINDNFNEQLKRFKYHKKECENRSKQEINDKENVIKYTKQPSFIPQNLKLQPYQLEGINWLRYCWKNNINSILADEMGLGKTIQTISFLCSLLKENHDLGPFLISAPLSTLPNWEREFALWAPDLYVTCYIGPKENRKVIREYDIYNTFDKNNKKDSNRFRFHVIITSFEMIYIENSLFQNVNWSVLVVDEAHRLKNSQSKFFKSLLKYNINYKLLLTGTPLQNNLEELYHLLEFLSQNIVDTKENFLSIFEDISKEDQILKLQNILGTRLLRRTKRNVLKDLPSKSESIIRIDLTPMQKKYYKAVLTKNYNQFASKTSNANSILNVVMELKKCCNHPYLFPNAYEEAKKNENDDLDFEALIQNSSKLVVMSKMFKRLKQDNHRILIFSQMTKMLDILEDFLDFYEYKYERIDGSVNSGQRQQAIDRFNAPGSDRFCFLLSTRAGGLGINLATADTVIIYDSDWNPHCDIQALSRAHRMGQQSKVMVYRFVTRNTVEERIIQVAKKKLMLTHLVVRAGTMASSSENKQSMSKRELDDIIKFGADKLFKEDSEGFAEGEIVYDDKAIEDLLNRDKVTENEGPDSGLAIADYFDSFKVANYTLAAEPKLSNSMSESLKNISETVSHVGGQIEEELPDIQNINNDPEFWANLIGDQAENIVNDELKDFGKGKRIKKQVTYYDVDNGKDTDVSEYSGVETTFESDSVSIEQDEYTGMTDSELKETNNQMVYNQILNENKTKNSALTTTTIKDSSSDDLSIRTIKGINAALYKFGLPSKDFNSVKKKWSVVGLKSMKEEMFRSYINSFVIKLYSQTEPILEKDLNPAVKKAYNFEDINKEQYLARLCSQELIYEKVREYFRFIPFFYPILISECILKKEELVFDYPESVKLFLTQTDGSRTVQVYNPNMNANLYEYPSNMEDLELLNTRIYFNIEDNGCTDLHFVWEVEERQRSKAIWWKLHDMWLLLALTVYGYNHLLDMFRDKRFEALNIPFTNYNLQYKQSFILRRLKLLEQALIAERAYQLYVSKNALFDPMIFTNQKKIISLYIYIRQLAESCKDLVIKTSCQNKKPDKNQSIKLLNVMTYLKQLIEELMYRLETSKNVILQESNTFIEKSKIPSKTEYKESLSTFLNQ